MAQHYTRQFAIEMLQATVDQATVRMVVCGVEKLAGDVHLVTDFQIRSDTFEFFFVAGRQNKLAATRGHLAGQSTRDA
jgi:hypothetical protein